MREIKFRAVIKGDAGVYDVWAIDNFHQKALVQRNCGDEWVEYKKIKYLWQFIGLPDKKGTEIYVGDIVQLAEYMGKKDVVDVRFDGLCITAGGLLTRPKTFETSEIVGNIHENPELLK